MPERVIAPLSDTTSTQDGFKIILIGPQLHWLVRFTRQHIGVFGRPETAFFGYAIISSGSSNVLTDALLPCTRRLLHQIPMQSAWDYVQKLHGYLMLLFRDPLSFSLQAVCKYARISCFAFEHYSITYRLNQYGTISDRKIFTEPV